MSEISEFSYQHPINIRTMLDLGILNATDEDFTAYERWCKLLDDTEVHARRCAWARANQCNPPQPKVVVDQMSKQEKFALRDRILGVVQMRGKNV